MAAKPKGKQYMEIHDMEQLSASIEGIWASKCGEVPEEITAVSGMACAALEPDEARKRERIKKALAGVSGVGGGATIVGSVGTGVGWGAASWWSWWGIKLGLTAAVPVAAPIALGALGALAVGYAGYLWFSSDSKVAASDKALKIFREGINDAITDSLWDKYKDRWQD